VTHAFRLRPIRGETLCGDGAAVFGEEGRRLFAVADGLGHGPEAHEASKAALDYIEEHRDKDLESLIWGCHEAVRKTRGLALFLVRITARTPSIIECGGIGNVECRTSGLGDFAPFPRDGVLGRNVRKVSIFTSPGAPGGIMALYSDGIRSRFDLPKYADCDPDVACEEILSEYGKHYDDASIMIIRT